MNHESERVCFWCSDPFWESTSKALTIKRTVCDTNGCHIEETWFHSRCALRAAAELTNALYDDA
jgi:hypothetical protein